MPDPRNVTDLVVIGFLHMEYIAWGTSVPDAIQNNSYNIGCCPRAAMPGIDAKHQLYTIESWLMELRKRRVYVGLRKIVFSRDVPYRPPASIR
jgi:hypothetical protein